MQRVSLVLVLHIASTVLPLLPMIIQKPCAQLTGFVQKKPSVHAVRYCPMMIYAFLSSYAKDPQIVTAKITKLMKKKDLVCGVREPVNLMHYVSAPRLNLMINRIVI